jgi:hypothetical protein
MSQGRSNDPWSGLLVAAGVLVGWLGMRALTRTRTPRRYAR